MFVVSFLLIWSSNPEYVSLLNPLWCDIRKVKLSFGLVFMLWDGSWFGVLQTSRRIQFCADVFRVEASQILYLPACYLLNMFGGVCVEACYCVVT